METEEIIREMLGDCIRHTDDNTQILLVKGYWIEEQLVVQNGDGNNPIVSNTIYLNGVPHDNNYVVSSAELCFKDEKPRDRPRYDIAQKKIYAYYPKSDFEKVLSIINQYPKNLELIFHDCNQTDQISVRLYCNNPNMII